MGEITYTFDSTTRYVTRGISEELPLELQMVLWSVIDDHVKTAKTVDYLQIFQMSQNGMNLEITHKQEEPKYNRTYIYPMKESYLDIVNRKIYVIDDVDHSTMLWSNEY